MDTKDVSTSSGGTLTVPALTAPAVTGGLAPALPPGALVGRGVAQTLQQLADAHNAVHGTDRRKRADLRALRAAYRRGAGRKPRKGRSRRQEGLARAQAHLAALAGKELPVEYADDRVLLPGEAKRLAVLALEGTAHEPLAHIKALTGQQDGDDLHPDDVESKAYTRKPATTGTKGADVPIETKAWSDESRVAALAARRLKSHGMPEDAVRRFGQPVGRTSDHEFHRIASAGDLKPGDLIELHEGHLHAVGGHPQYVPPAGGGPDARGHYNVPLAGHDRPARLLDNLHSGNVRQYKPNAADHSAVAHAASYEAAMTAGSDRAQAHGDAERLHLQAADAHKAAGNEVAALEHLSAADHHRDAAAMAGGVPDPTEHQIGSRVAAPSGKEGEVVARGTNGLAVRHDDGTVSVHKPETLLPGSDNTLRGTVAARDVKPGDYVWDTHPSVPGGGPGYRVNSHEVTGSGADEIVHHTFDDGLGTGHRYHHADAQLRVVRGADAARHRGY